MYHCKCKEVEKEKAIKDHLDCEFIRINPDEKDFDMYVEVSKIHNHIKQSSKKSLIDKISKRLLKLESKSDHLIKSKVLKYVVKKKWLSI